MACNCIVIAREVWDTRDLATQVIDEKGEVRASALQTRFEPEDLNALEIALRLKDAQGGKVTVLTFGEPGAVDVAREALYRGADEAHRVDVKRADVDTQGTAKLLAAAVHKLGGADVILLGVTVPEGENSLLGSHLAALMDLEQISYVDSVEKVEGGLVTARRAIEMGYETVETPCPAVLTAGVALLEDDPRTPRSAKAMLKLKHKKTDIPLHTPAALGFADVATLRTTRVAKREAVPERVIQSVDVDPENEPALKAMLETVLKGG
jgi:electron transfer flavoprotein beta subunit